MSKQIENIKKINSRELEKTLIRLEKESKGKINSNMDDEVGLSISTRLPDVEFIEQQKKRP